METRKSELALFKQVFLDVRDLEIDFGLANRTTTINNPTFTMWEDIRSKYTINYVTYDSHEFTPQTSWVKSILGYENTAWCRPFVGNTFMESLVNGHADLYYRTRNILSIAKDLIDNPVGSPPVRCIDDGHDEIHPGKALLSAHQVLNRKVSMIEFDRYGSASNIKSLNDLQNLYEGTMRGFIEKPLSGEYHVHLFCYHGEWSIPAPGHGLPDNPPFNMKQFCEELTALSSAPTVTFFDIDSNTMVSCPLEENSAIIEQALRNA